MSYAGPASRPKRTTDVAPNKAASSRGTEAAIRAPLKRSASQSSDHTGSALFGAGVALGVVVGASIALLLAPQSGSDTRRTLARRSRQIGLRGHDAWDDLREEFRHAVKRRRLASLRARHRAEEPDAS